MLLPKSSCVCIPCFKVCCFKDLSGQSTIFGLYLGLTGKQKGVVIYMYLEHSPGYIDSKYIWIHGSNSLGSNVSLKYHFCHF